MEHPGPGDKLSVTILARTPIAEKEGVRAEQAVVVQALDHGSPFGLGRIISGRGDQGEGIVEVDYVRPLSTD
jgi:hypothetical protein